MGDFDNLRANRIIEENRDSEWAWDYDKDIFKVEAMNKDSINQNLENIILTNKGERVFFPNFGVGIERYLFERLNDSLMNSLYTEIISQIAEFEKRIIVDFEISGIYLDPKNAKKLKIDIAYRRKGDSQLVWFKREIEAE